jgi:hypothetical protein
MTEAPKNQCFKPGSLITHFETEGLKVTPAIRSLDNLVTKLTCADVQKCKRELAIYILTHDDPDPEFRRELLAEFDACPCCQSWLGHNRPPADDGADSPMPRRQKSFDFDR